MASGSIIAVLLALAPVAAETPFTVEPVAEGVHLFRPTVAAHGWANSLVVERADGLLVVDAQPTAEAAGALLAEIGRFWSRLPVVRQRWPTRPTTSVRKSAPQHRGRTAGRSRPGPGRRS
jgi:hypothetical protein